jgi:succinate-acetate transporter protein
MSAADATRIVLRPMGNPLPLGFLALAAATLLVSGLQLAWLKPSDGQAVALILIAFVFPLQLLSSIFGFLGRDVVAGTGMGVLAGSWLSIALVSLTSPPATTSDALGLFLLAAAVAMLVSATAATTSKLVPAAVLATTALRFATTGAYQLTAGAAWKHVAGLVGLGLCALAVYESLAMALEDAVHRTSLPLGRRRGGRDALAGEPSDQVASVEHAAGVRQQL